MRFPHAGGLQRKVAHAFLYYPGRLTQVRIRQAELGDALREGEHAPRLGGEHLAAHAQKPVRRRGLEHETQVPANRIQRLAHELELQAGAGLGDVRHPVHAALS
jgi:hypothetical protein